MEADPMRRRIAQIGLYVAVLAIFAAGVWGLYVWTKKPPEEAEETTKPAASDPARPIKLSVQAQKNLGLKSERLQPTSIWRTIEVPGVVIDRPGISDRGVVAPVTGIVTRIFHYPGDAVEPETPLFRIRLVSESLHAAQLELFKATRQIEIARDERKRLLGPSESGAVARTKIIEIDNQIRLLEVNQQAYRQDLQSRGLPEERIEAAARGEFVTEIVVKSPGEQAVPQAEVALTAAAVGEQERLPFSFELHDLKVELGKQVEAGEVLCSLADHRSLLIEGRGFKQDLPLIQGAAVNGWKVGVEFEQADKSWPPLPEELQIQHVANLIDIESRTFGFFLPLENQWRSFDRNGQARLVWRFRPGDRVRLHVQVEKFENVFVVPLEAVVQEEAEAYVFSQNGEYFSRKPVHVLYQDRRHVVIANDGSVRSSTFVAKNAAASIHRIGKAQVASGQPADVHVHPDGTVHAVH
jgi:membrane fusion protein, heavy metal efflux system